MRLARGSVVGLLAVAGLAGAYAFAQPATEKPRSANPAAAQPAGEMPEMPPEMQKMMEAYMEAATPGPMHEHLMKGVGTWEGKVTMYNPMGGPPEQSTCTTEISPMFGGRYTKAKIKGTTSMGPFEGLGLYGYDNAAETFQAVWLDSMGTGIATGTGELSPDGKTMTWNLTYTCPMTHEPTWMREVETYKSADEVLLEMYGPNPITGEEMKMMEIVSKRIAKGDPRQLGAAGEE